MPEPMTRTNAVLTTRITRAAAAALAIGAVALALTGLPERRLPEPGSGLPPGAAPDPGSAAAPSARVRPVAFEPVDAEAVAARFAMLDNAPKIPTPTTVTVNTENGPAEVSNQESQPAGDIADRVRFLGVVRTGDTHAAFINADGRQRFVREGAQIDPPADRPEFARLTIERITPAFIVVSDGTARDRLTPAPRSGPSVTMADGGVIEPAAVAPATTPANASLPGSNLPQREIDRRARSMERARNGERPRTVIPQGVRSTVNMGARRTTPPEAAAENADE